MGPLVGNSLSVHGGRSDAARGGQELGHFGPCSPWAKVLKSA